MQQHTRTGVSHHSPDLLPSCRLVAVDRTVRTSRLARLERTLAEAEQGVIEQGLAISAQLAPGATVMPVAIESDHGCECLGLTSQPWVL